MAAADNGCGAVAVPGFVGRQGNEGGGDALSVPAGNSFCDAPGGWKRRCPPSWASETIDAATDTAAEPLQERIESVPATNHFEERRRPPSYLLPIPTITGTYTMQRFRPRSRPNSVSPVMDAAPGGLAENVAQQIAMGVYK